MSPTVESVALGELSDSDRRSIAELICRTWPKAHKDVVYRMNQLRALAEGYQGLSELAPRAFIVRGEEGVDANTIIEPRTIGTTAGDLTVLGLGKVCSHPGRRGEGLGALVVKAAFAMVDQGLFAFSLFQTTHHVRPFYERLNCCVVENDVINSQHADAADLHPFADEVVMRYPADPDWPEGVIDLRGPGY